MLPAAHRIRTAAQFRDTTRRGARATRGSVVVMAAFSSEQPTRQAPPQFGVITSSAVGGSVARHRAARRIRAELKTLLPLVPTGTSIVVRALPGADRDPRLAEHVRDGVRALLHSKALP